ncbi:cell division protein SepF [Romboutsia lituseburensis]|uniref:Cell division protein SepF n=1 Tax=Romboutsia lituseburensis DSM 797 TaxID=1121325 RepID=A0A1G9QDN2_9FIRM|nr:cell division protein SepF [Romboutsia lituseburensis]CEH35468.1 Cell division protein SepF [Romboutsia lituseburensis]SDM09182.1 cell division inhibitor SepF [Romboutsia lituseburensis DSM 797]
MGDGLFSKFKNWVVDEDDDYEYMEEEEEIVAEEDEIGEGIGNAIKSTNIVKLHTTTQMKVVIVEPKKYDEVTTIADHLKSKRAVIVNLENLNDATARKSIFDFMNGAVYVLDGTIQKVSKAIFILAPNNVDIDASIKKELENSKTLFPWQNTK